MTSRGDPKHSEIELLEDDPFLGSETSEHVTPTRGRYPVRWILSSAVLMISCITLAVQNVQLRNVEKCTSTFSTDLRMLIMIIENPSNRVLCAKQILRRYRSRQTHI